MTNRHHRQFQLGASRYVLLNEYFVELEPLTLALTGANGGDYLPTTAVTWNKSSFNDQDFANICQTYHDRDDVWNADFTAVVLLIRPTHASCKIATKNTLSTIDRGRRLPCGPLVIEKSTSRLFSICKLVSDTQFAFFSATVPTTDLISAFYSLDLRNRLPDDRDCNLPTADSPAQIDIAVPSRLYYTATENAPLAGIRIAVKDSIALRGLRTGFGSKAWYDVCEEESQTAPCIQRLIDAGAVVVGKLVSSEFCEGVEPSEWTQGVCPYNPRGDGQQKPSSSSTGSAVAAAAYEWLDVAVGTDTGGSIRHPAGVNGLFGQRPTAGSVDLKGVLGATNLFNTVGIFARSVELFVKVGSFLSDVKVALPIISQQRKYNILYPVRELCPTTQVAKGHLRWFPHPDADPAEWTEAEKQMQKMVTQMEAELDCRRTFFNIYDFWTATTPKGQPKCLDEATGRIYGDITTSSACATGIDDFIQRYREVHDGRDPLIGEVVKARLDYGRHLADSSIAAALEAAAAFKSWMETTFFALDDQETTTLIVLPQSHGVPQYRDDESRWGSQLFIESFSIYAFGYLCGCPDYTIPINEVPYLSRVTQQTEYLPVSCSLVGRPGADAELFEVVHRLYKAGIISNVSAGSRTFMPQVYRVPFGRKKN